MHILSLLFIFSSILIITSAAPTSCPAWGYDDLAGNGPAHWGDLCPAYAQCKTGTMQSPIDLVSNSEISGAINHILPNYQNVTNITFINEKYSYEGKDGNTTNNILSIVGKGTFVLQGFHFHAPSEHTINGHQFPLEVHFVHTDEAGNYAVLGLLYDYSTIPHPTEGDAFLSTLVPFLPQIEDPHTFVTVPTVDISSQLNIEKGFFRYEGSTTSPPCIPGVQWFVSKSPLPVDPVILDEFTTVLNNARPVQPANGRSIIMHTPGSCIGNIKLLKRTNEGSSWTVGNTEYTILDVSIENQGSCPIITANFPFYIVGNVEQTWNLESMGTGNGKITIFGNIPAGQIYSGAGLIVSNYTTYAMHSSASPVTCSAC